MSGRVRRVVAPVVRRWFPFLVAGAAWVGAALPVSMPIWSAIVLSALPFVVRRRVVVIVCVAATASVLSANALGGLTPVREGEWSGRVEMVGDPVRIGTGTRVDVTTDDGRFELVGWGAKGRVLAAGSMGDRLAITGSVRTLTNPERARSRHVRGRIVLATSSAIGRAPWAGAIDGLRSVVLAGGRSLPERQRPVYGGFVLGDDRGRSEEVTRDFEAAGMSHLLVVSGANVAFVLTVAGPVLSRLTRRSRLVATLGLLLVFAAMTRFEPSVLRATAMAVVAAVGVASARPGDARRALAVAITALVLVDPLLIHSIGFRLSAAASAAIIWFAPALSRHLVGPQRVRDVVAVTLAAQFGVAPLLVPIFGPMPLAAVPANVLAAPVAGLVMVWGCSVGVVAGIAGGAVGEVLQSPVRLGLWWIMGVARVANSAPEVGVDLPVIVSAAAGVGVVATMRRRIGERREAADPRMPQLGSATCTSTSAPRVSTSPTEPSSWGY